ncbi:MAG TPA: SUMF1/EgtB/PvdO family nonheme iron enzyme [Anaerolineae bacterium]|nr:SUMF1/EgtB/PvdO family nonheme iron enzyme [Anaerolineae bacterium]
MTDPVSDSERPPWETIEAAFRTCARALKERREAEQRLLEERDFSELEAGRVFEESVAGANHTMGRMKELEASTDKAVGQLEPLRGRHWDTPRPTLNDGVPQERLGALLHECEATAAELGQAAKDYPIAKAKEEGKRVAVILLMVLAAVLACYVTAATVATVTNNLGHTSTPTVEPTATPTAVGRPDRVSSSTAVGVPTFVAATSTATPSGHHNATATAIPAIPTAAPVPAVAMVLIPSGEFAMGNPQSQSRQNLDDFYIDIYEVTNGDYGACVQAGVCDPPRNRSSESRDHYFGNSQYERYPVIYVTWYDARTYCEWAGKRLPTGAEWEKAARGTDGRSYPWGSQFDGRRLNYCDVSCRYRYRDRAFNDGYAETAPVCSYTTGSSPFGVCDMAGNVSEWVADSDGSLKVVRGGSWHSAATYVRTFDRWSHSPGAVDDGTGFRCAK